jgi:hypothetical protein
MNKHSTCIGILILLLALCLLAPARFALAQTSLDWRFYGGDLANTRYQNVDQINPSNVANLKVAWIFHTGVLDPKAELEVSPIEVNGHGLHHGRARRCVCRGCRNRFPEVGLHAHNDRG